jgi:hypothetical protein
VIPPLGPQPDARSVVEPESAARLLLGRNLQPFAPPNTLHAIFADKPARQLEQRRNATVPIAAILTSQGNDRLGQPAFILALRGLITLRASRLMQQMAGPPFTESLFPSVCNGDPPPLGT